MENEHPETTPVQAPPTPPVTPQLLKSQYSEFDGTTLQLLGWRLLGILLSIVTLGIATPWAQCMIYRWETKHTLVEGKRLHFDGTGLQLLGNYLLWGFLTLITLGIFTVFLPVQMNQWRASHTKFADEKNPPEPVSGWAIAAAVLASLLVLTLAGGGLYLYLDKNPIGEDVSLSHLFQDGIFKKEEEQFVIPEGSIVIQDGDNVIIWHDQETLPTEPAVIDDIRQPRPDDDGDFWYVKNEDGLNVRTGPDVSYDLIRTLPHGAEIEVFEWESGWAFLGDGWCAGNDLRINYPKDAVRLDKSIVGTWAFVFERERDHYMSDRYYDVVVLELREDGTFRSKTVEVSFSTVNNEVKWRYQSTVHYPGEVLESEFWGNYTFDGSCLRMNYLVSNGKGDRKLLEKIETEVYSDGKYLWLEDPDEILIHDPSVFDPEENGECHAVLLPMSEDADWHSNPKSVVAKYIDG